MVCRMACGFDHLCLGHPRSGRDDRHGAGSHPRSSRWPACLTCTSPPSADGRREASRNERRKVMTQANKVVVQIDAGDHPAGCGERCPACRLFGQTGKRPLRYVQRRAAAASSGRSAADALLLAIGRRPSTQTTRPAIRDDCERFISHKDLRLGKYRQIRTPRKRRWNPIGGLELRSVLLQRLRDRAAGGTTVTTVISNDRVIATAADRAAGGTRRQRFASDSTIATAAGPGSGWNDDGLCKFARVQPIATAAGPGSGWNVDRFGNFSVTVVLQRLRDRAAGGTKNCAKVTISLSDYCNGCGTGQQVEPLNP